MSGDTERGFFDRLRDAYERVVGVVVALADVGGEIVDGGAAHRAGLRVGRAAGEPPPAVSGQPEPGPTEEDGDAQ